MGGPRVSQVACSVSRAVRLTAKSIGKQRKRMETAFDPLRQPKIGLETERLAMTERLGCDFR